MGRQRLAALVRAQWGRAWGWLSLDGRLRPAQPLALLPGPLALGLNLLFPARWLLYIAYVYLLLALAAYLWARIVGPRVRLRRSLRGEWAQVGDDLEEEWELSNSAPLPLLWLEIDDASTLPGYSAQRVAAAGAEERQIWRTAARCTRRGVYRLGPLTARLGDPLGLFRFEWSEQDTRQIVVYPPLVRLPAMQLPRGQRGGLAQADLLQIHATPSVGGLRDYAPGDPPSRIHWPYVARYGELYVKEFDQERAGALWIVLDLHAPAYAGDTPREQRRPAAERPDYSQSSLVEPVAGESRPVSLGDLAVVLGASLAAQAISEGRIVGLLADDGRRRLVLPGGGPRQLWRILAELVDVEPTGDLPLGELLRQGRGIGGAELAGAALVVVTPALDAAWLPGLAASRGGRPGGALAMLLAEEAGRAAPAVAALAAQGVAAQSFEPGRPLPLINPPRRRAAARVSPLGKIIQAEQG